MAGCNNLYWRTLKKCKRQDAGNKVRTVGKKARVKQSSASISYTQQEGGEDGFNLKHSTNSVRHRVQPLGNLYLSSSNHNSRDSGLGTLQILTDELVLEILGFLDAANLGISSSVSKSLYVFCNHEPLWRNLVLEHLNGDFVYRGSWRSTYVSTFNPLFSISISKLVVRDFYSDYLFQHWLCANLEMKPEWLQVDNIPRRKGISIEEFVIEFEEPNIPVILEGCLDNWAAMEKWDREYLLNLCGEVKFAVGPVEMILRDYFRYSDLAKEERPLYLFDPKFFEKIPILGSDYTIPEFFKEDLFGVLGTERPDYRWIIIGPTGSGSSFHIDPNSTSAWNAVIRGSKKWILFPPNVVPPGVHPSPDGSEVVCPVSIVEWFMNFYKETKKLKMKPIECVCKEGEVIFVPNGWWHIVINLEESVAITQNYVSRRNLLNVFDFLKRPNASALVSGTRDRSNLYNKFRDAFEASFPGTIDELMLKADEKKLVEKKLSFWESVADSKAGSFKFSF